MFEIRLNHPPKVEPFAFPVDATLKTIHPQSLQAMKSALGNRLNPDYEKGLKSTPMQKARLVTITVSALAILAAVGCAIACAIAFSKPLLVAAVVLAIAGVAGLIYRYTMRLDIDQPKERNKITQEIAQKTFKKIASQYSDEELVGYKLLDSIVPEAVTNANKRAAFYERFRQLRAYHQGIQNWKANEKQKVNARWDAETAPARAWRDREVLIIDQQLALINQQEHIMRMNTRMVEAHRRRPATGLRVANAVVSVSNTMTEWQLRDRRAVICHQASEMMSPWNHWEAQSKANINQEYTHHSNRIEEEFRKAKLAS